MSDRDLFLQSARSSGVNLHDPRTYQSYLKKSALTNSYAKDVYHQQLQADHSINANEALTQDLYIKANDLGAKTIGQFADVVTWGAHDNLDEAYKHASQGEFWAGMREVRQAGCNIVGASLFYSGALKGAGGGLK